MDQVRVEEVRQENVRRRVKVEVGGAFEETEIG